MEYARIRRGVYEGCVGEVLGREPYCQEYIVHLCIDRQGFDIRKDDKCKSIYYKDLYNISENEYYELIRCALIKDKSKSASLFFEAPLWTREEIKSMSYNNKSWKVEKIIFNNPATIIIWKDGTKTISKCGPCDVYDPEKGVAICFMKKMLELDPDKKDRKTTANREAYNILQKANKQYAKYKVNKEV